MTEHDDPVETAWARVLAQWEDPEAHARFIALCQSLNRLSEAGGRYRQVRDGDDDAERRALAAEQIDRLLAAAMQRLEVHRTPPPPRRVWLLLVAAAVMVLLVGSTLWMLLHPG